MSDPIDIDGTEALIRERGVDWETAIRERDEARAELASVVALAEHKLTDADKAFTDGWNGAMAAARTEVERARAAGYAEAVEALRDDDRYRNWWWTADGAWQHKPPGRYWSPEARGHLADYLATVGPVVVGGQPEQKETDGQVHDR